MAVAERYLYDTRFDKLLAELGISRDQFDFEMAAFDLSPKEWLQKKLQAGGWVREKPPEPPPACKRPCCNE